MPRTQGNFWVYRLKTIFQIPCNASITAEKPFFWDARRRSFFGTAARSAWAQSAWYSYDNSSSLSHTVRILAR